MIQIIKLHYNDDIDASVDAEFMVSSSIDKAKEIVLNTLKSDFSEDSWSSLEEAEKDLGESLYSASWHNNIFTWWDNGQGDTYIIKEFDDKKIDSEFEHLCYV